jgi:sugar lactone lactonase YvrE
VFVYSLPALELLGHVTLPELKLPGRQPIGALPNWIAFTPDSKLVYVSNSALRSVSAIDTGVEEDRGERAGRGSAQAPQHAGDALTLLPSSPLGQGGPVRVVPTS